MINRVGEVGKAERHLQMDFVCAHLRFDSARNRGQREFTVVQLAPQRFQVFLLAIDGDVGDLVKLKREREWSKENLLLGQLFQPLILPRCVGA